MARGAGELFDERAALFGLQAQCLVNGTLANEEEAVLGKTGAIEQLVEISKANLLAIEQVLLATAAIGATSNFDFGEWKVKEPIVVGDGERNLGETEGGASLIPRMTSSTRFERMPRPASPSAQRRASTTFDLPLPFGPTIAVIPGVKAMVVLSAKVLKPLSRTSRSRSRLTLSLPR